MLRAERTGGQRSQTFALLLVVIALIHLGGLSVCIERRPDRESGDNAAEQKLLADLSPTLSPSGLRIFRFSVYGCSLNLDVRYVARLARLELSDAEVAEYQAQLSDVLKFVEALRQVDVSDVEPTAHASAVFNVFREDTAQPSFTSKEALANAPRQANDLFVVTKVIE